MTSSKKSLHVLHLARWYPNRMDPMPGLFIQRHAEAVAHYAQVALVYAQAVESNQQAPLYEIDYVEETGVRTARVYYRISRYHIPLISPMVNLWRFYHANVIGIHKVRKAGEKFDLIHLHVLTRLGVLALFFKWTSGIPYVITEHWTRYLKVRKEFRGIFRKQITRLVVHQAAVITTVSNDLTRAMKSHNLVHPDYRVVYNVVDASFFEVAQKFPQKENTTLKEFVHVSCFTDVHKNISGLLRIIKKLSKAQTNFHFSLVGEGEDLEKMKTYAKTLDIPEKALTFTGLLEGKKLAEAMSQSDALVIFSNYENMPVVINESFVLGIPVFSTNVGGIAEMVNNTNGRLVPKGDEEAMLQVLKEFLENRFSFQKEKISEQAKQIFSSMAVGETLVNIYEDALKKASHEF